jgi:hypothetical protein
MSVGAASAPDRSLLWVKDADTEPKSWGSLHFVAKIKIVAACRMGG